MLLQLRKFKLGVPMALLQRRCCQHRSGEHRAPVRVRFAPSPTGSVHLGGLRTALFNYLFAAKHGGQFLIRIEDTDKTREVEGSIDEIVSMLQWAGIHHDEGPDKPGAVGPYTQSERLDIYHKHAGELVESSRAYPCFCSQKRLSRLRESQVRVIFARVII